jgi:hypothetical protein
VVAYVIDTPSRRLDSLIIHTQPTSAEKADVPTIEIMAEIIERV